MEEEAVPGLRELLEVRALALAVVPALRLQLGPLGLDAGARLHRGAPAQGCLCCDHRREHGVLFEAQFAAQGPASKVRMQGVGTAHDARVEVGVEVGRAPDIRPCIMRDLGHVGVQVLGPPARSGAARASLHIYGLDAMAVPVWDKTAQGEGIRHGLADIITSARHGLARLKRATRGPTSHAAARSVANRMPQLLTVGLAQLLGTQEDA
mmetsp:Transcript_67154/g.208178  ORF Transcript_67154/g.208178 Transcript_67154/m.208178 type:complete len:209 (-) Transcript_67154:994-1620(-)